MAESGEGVFGTPRYLAPEQTRGEPATFASDVFSLGVVLYEMTTGKTAFAAPHVLQVMEQIRSVDPGRMAAEAPAPFRPSILPMLEPDPRNRTITHAADRRRDQRGLRVGVDRGRILRSRRLPLWSSGEGDLVPTNDAAVSGDLRSRRRPGGHPGVPPGTPGSSIGRRTRPGRSPPSSSTRPSG